MQADIAVAAAEVVKRPGIRPTKRSVAEGGLECGRFGGRCDPDAWTDEEGEGVDEVECRLQV